MARCVQAVLALCVDRDEGCADSDTPDKLALVQWSYFDVEAATVGLFDIPAGCAPGTVAP